MIWKSIISVENCNITDFFIITQECTDIARDQETYLLISTLGGGLTAVDPITSETKWFIEEEPALKMENSPSPSQYLPDPRDGSLYQFNFGTLKKLPYTIPELVASAPCKSSDGILFSGKKSDSWFLIDPKVTYFMLNVMLIFFYEFWL